ncbi:MAG TPA: hypothetical protein VKA53_05665, partial [Thermoanaerobaculia bacterium]|nr:hypothetical protein [Thermoanaerobaculia bacterium]
VMRRSVLVCGSIMLMLGSLSPGGPARAATWHLFGSNEIAVDHYRVTGDKNASPYQFTGNFWNDRLSLHFDWDNQRGKTISLQGELLGAHDDYFAEDGAVLSTLSLKLQDGGVAVPFRFSVGDEFADLSRRALQRQVRGASLELQPQSKVVDQSILLVSGSGTSSWRETFNGHGNDLFFNGVSYLAASKSGRSSAVLNWVNVHQDAAVAASSGGTVVGDHRIAGLFAETTLRGVHLEGEVARLDRSHGGGSDRSFYGQLDEGRGRFRWRLRYEDNGQTFDPTGAVGIIPNRRIAEAHARWRGSRGELRARVQDIATDVSGSLPKRTTKVAALSYQGSPLRRHPGFEVVLGGEVNDFSTEDGSLDQRFESYRLSLSDRLGSGWLARYRARYRRLEDHLLAEASNHSLDHTLAVGRSFRAGSGRGAALQVQVGGTYRDQQGSGAYRRWSPSLDLGVVGRSHRLHLHLSFLRQDFRPLTVSDLTYSTQRLTYTFVAGPQVLTLEVGNELRRPEAALKTDSLRATVRYRWSFDVRGGDQ